MVELIQELLFANNCVIVPGFGAFIGNFQSAEIRLSENKIFPPTKNIAFNKLLQVNDGLLMNYVAQYFTITYKEAEEKVDAFAKYCNNSLFQNKCLVLNNIGRFTLDVEHNIQFQPYNNVNYLLDSFGLKTMVLTPILRLKDSGIEISDNYQGITHSELVQDFMVSKKHANINRYWVAAAILVAIVTSLIGVNFHNKKYNLNYASVISMFNNTPVKTYILPTKMVITKPVSKFIQNKISSINKEIVINDTLQSSKNIVVSNSKTFIVIGTFFEEKRAEKLRIESEKIGFNTTISIDNKDALFRVIVAAENKEVVATLDKIKSTINRRAWVYCMKCNLK